MVDKRSGQVKKSILNLKIAVALQKEIQQPQESGTSDDDRIFLLELLTSTKATGAGQ